MKTRRLDGNWDWTFGRGKTDYADKAESVAQRIKQSLQCFTYDWFHDLDYGINWFGLMEKPTAWADLEASIKTAILAEDGVVDITSFDLNFDPDTRHVVYSVEVNDIYHNIHAIKERIDLGATA